MSNKVFKLHNKTEQIFARKHTRDPSRGRTLEDHSRKISFSDASISLHYEYHREYHEHKTEQEKHYIDIFVLNYSHETTGNRMLLLGVQIFSNSIITIKLQVELFSVELLVETVFLEQDQSICQMLFF